MCDLQGYHGILCSACDANHGRAESGQCSHCGNKFMNIIYGILLGIWMTVIGVLMMASAISTGFAKNETSKDGRHHSHSELLKVNT